jgi:hypothetical protein
VFPFDRWREVDSNHRRLAADPAPPGGFSGDANKIRKLVRAEAAELLRQCSEILRGSRDRYFHMPSFMNVPDLLVDLQYLETRPNSELDDLTVVASLNPPYAQALVSRYSNYISRIGLDDPDVDWLVEGYRAQADEDPEPGQGT